MHPLYLHRWPITAHEHRLLFQNAEAAPVEQPEQSTENVEQPTTQLDPQRAQELDAEKKQRSLTRAEHEQEEDLERGKVLPEIEKKLDEAQANTTHDIAGGREQENKAELNAESEQKIDIEKITNSLAPEQQQIIRESIGQLDAAHQETLVTFVQKLTPDMCMRLRNGEPLSVNDVRNLGKILPTLNPQEMELFKALPIVAADGVMTEEDRRIFEAFPRMSKEDQANVTTLTPTAVERKKQGEAIPDYQERLVSRADNLVQAIRQHGPGSAQAEDIRAELHDGLRWLDQVRHASGTAAFEDVNERLWHTGFRLTTDPEFSVLRLDNRRAAERTANEATMEARSKIAPIINNPPLENPEGAGTPSPTIPP